MSLTSLDKLKRAAEEEETKTHSVGNIYFTKERSTSIFAVDGYGKCTELKDYLSHVRGEIRSV